MDSVHFGRAGLGRCSGRLSPACNHLGRHSLSLSPDCRPPATFEGPAAGTVYALACGVFCDLLLPSSIPCFYTLILPLVGLAAGLLSQSLIPAGYLCSAAAALPAYLLTGIFHCIVLWAQGHPAWGAAMSVTLRELCVSLLWSLPMTWLFRRVYLRVHVDD